MPCNSSSNINKTYFLRAMQFFWFPLPTLALFYQSNGLSFQDLLLLKSAGSIAAMLMEVPTGYFADRYGRKLSIIIGITLCFCSSFGFLYFSSFFAFLIAEFVLGSGLSFISGADTALVYDSLKAEQQEHRYGKVESRLSSIAGFAEAFGGLLGAFLSSLSLSYPFVAQSMTFAIGIIVALTLIEPKQHNSSTKMTNWRDLKKVISLALFSDRVLKYLIYTSSFIALGTYIIVFFSQAYMEFIKLPIAYFGVAWATFHFVLGIASLSADWFAKNIKPITTLHIFILTLAISYCGLFFSNSAWGLIFVGLIYAVRAVRQPLTRMWINQLAESEIRATIQSTHNFVFRLSFVVAGPLLGLLVTNVGLDFTFLIISLGILLLGQVLVMRLGQVCSKSHRALFHNEN